MSKAFTLGGVSFSPGERRTLDLAVARSYTHSEITMPVHVVMGRQPGPCLFISAAIHGDEINGVEIIRRLLKLPRLKSLRGVLIAVPVVNVHGLANHSRYLPDRRDLNRSFPGSESGSLAARLAHLFMSEIVDNADYGIDLHTGAIHRANLPQIRANLDDKVTADLAKSFRVPVLLNSALRDGSLRALAAERGIPILVYEAGEALRFDEFSIQVGVRGVIEVMRNLKMLPPSKYKRKKFIDPFIAHSSLWVRAPESGILRATQSLGARVRKGDVLGMIADPFGEVELEVKASTSGVIIGRTNLPLVNEGDALYHIARFEKPSKVAAQMEELQSMPSIAPVVLDEPPIV